MAGAGGHRAECAPAQAGYGGQDGEKLLAPLHFRARYDKIKQQLLKEKWGSLMRRLTKPFLCLLLSLLLAAGGVLPAFAEAGTAGTAEAPLDPATVTLNQPDAKAGENFTISIALSENSGACGIDFTYSKLCSIRASDSIIGIIASKRSYKSDFVNILGSTTCHRACDTDESDKGKCNSFSHSATSCK